MHNKIFSYPKSVQHFRVRIRITNNFITTLGNIRVISGEDDGEIPPLLFYNFNIWLLRNVYQTTRFITNFVVKLNFENDFFFYLFIVLIKPRRLIYYIYIYQCYINRLDLVSIKKYL